MQIEWVDITYIEDIKPKQENDSASIGVIYSNKGPDIDISKEVIDLPIRHKENNK